MPWRAVPEMRPSYQFSFTFRIRQMRSPWGREESGSGGLPGHLAPKAAYTDTQGDGAPRGWQAMQRSHRYEVESQEPNPGCLATEQKSQGSLVANNTGPNRALASSKLHGPGQLTLPL